MVNFYHNCNHTKTRKMEIIVDTREENKKKQSYIIQRVELTNQMTSIMVRTAEV